MTTVPDQQALPLFVCNQMRIKGFIASLMGDFAAVPWNSDPLRGRFGNNKMKAEYHEKQPSNDRSIE